MMTVQEMMDCMMMGPMGWTIGFFWVLVLGLVVRGLYRLFSTRGASMSSHEFPLETLQRRYAEGDLTTKEYEERKQVLGK